MMAWYFIVLIVIGSIVVVPIIIILLIFLFIMIISTISLKIAQKTFDNMTTEQWQEYLESKKEEL